MDYFCLASYNACYNNGCLQLKECKDKNALEND